MGLFCDLIQHKESHLSNDMKWWKMQNRSTNTSDKMQENLRVKDIN